MDHEQLASMKILKLCYEYPPVGGGGAKVVFSLIRHLVDMGHSADLVTMKFDKLPRKEQLQQLEINRIPCWRTSANISNPLQMFIYLMRALPLALRLARKNEYTINHTHFIFPDGVLALLLKKITGLNYVLTAHGSDVPGYNPDRFVYLHILLRPLWRAVVKNASTVICPSVYLEHLILKTQPDAITTIIPNGIDLNRFNPNRDKLRRILVVSRIFKRKGIQYFLHSLAGLKHDYEVCIVGDGPYLDELRRLVDELELTVRFTGYLDNKSQSLRDLYETSQIFVFPSSAENFPIVLLEAMTAGLAIITTRGTGCAGVVGTTALTVPPKDSDAIRQALVKLTSDEGLRTQLGRQAHERVKLHFTEEQVSLMHQDLYQSISADTRRKSSTGRTEI